MKRKVATMALILSVAACTMSPISTYAAEWSLQNNGKWFYLDDNGNKATNSWLHLADVWYYVKSDGSMVTGLQKINGKNYFFHPSGAMAYNTWVSADDDKWYYAGGDGALVTGWLEASGGIWYYFDDNGKMLSNTTRNINGVQYSFEDNGRLKMGYYDGYKYMDLTGTHDEAHDIKVRGKAEKETLSDAGDTTHEIPGWMLQRIFDDGWKIALNAEKTDYGTMKNSDNDETYIKYYDLETSRKLIFFTNTDYVVQAIGMYFADNYGKPYEDEDFQTALALDFSDLYGYMDQDPYISDKVDKYCFAETFAIYFSENEEDWIYMRDNCPTMYRYMTNFVESVRMKSGS